MFEMQQHIRKILKEGTEYFTRLDSHVETLEAMLIPKGKFAPETKLLFQKNERNDFITKELKSMKSGFQPALYLTHPLIQTILSINMPDPFVHYTRQYVRMDDGGQVSLDWVNPRVTHQTFYPEDHRLYGTNYRVSIEKDQNTPIVIIVHGLTGGSNKGHLIHLADNFANKGYAVAVFQSRGVNRTPMLTPRPYRAGCVEDLRKAMLTVRQEHPKNPIVVIGASMGANFLMRLLGEKGNEINAVCALLISPPFDVRNCLEFITGTVYEKHFLEDYKNEFLLPYWDVFNQVAPEMGINLQEVIKKGTLEDFHTSFSCKLLGIPSYYELVETYQPSERTIRDIDVPTFALFALDDPICHKDQVPKEKLGQNPNIILGETTYGSHLSWFEGAVPRRVTSFPDPS